MSDIDTTPPGSADPAGGADSATPDQVSTVTSRSWLERLRDSLIASVIGMLLVGAAVALLSWNEGTEVAALGSLDLAARLVVEAPAARIDPALQARLVHLTGSLAAAAPARDPLFGVIAADAVRLQRRVEMFQWEEHATSTTEKSLGGGSTTQTTYEYRKTWSDRAINSGPFRARAGHANPPLPLAGLTSDALDVRLGPYHLDAAVLDLLAPTAPVLLPETAPLPPGWQHGDSGPTRARDPQQPAVGDVRVSFVATLAGSASVIAGQQGDRLAAFAAPDGRMLALATDGVASAAAMVSAERAAARGVAWALRLAGFLLCLVGLVLMVRPLAVLVSVVPVLETVVDVTAILAMAGLAALVTLTTIAVARVVLQPLLSLGLLAAGLAIAWGCIRLRRPGSAPLG